MTALLSTLQTTPAKTRAYARTKSRTRSHAVHVAIDLDIYKPRRRQDRGAGCLRALIQLCKQAPP